MAERVFVGEPDPDADFDQVIRYVPYFREFGIPINDGGSSYSRINHCPWCGQKLPDSLRDEWFDYIESQGFSTITDEEEDRIPKWLYRADWKELANKP